MTIATEAGLAPRWGAGPNGPARESRTDNLRRLLKPRSVVVLGASESDIRIGGRVMQMLKAHPHLENVVGVNPKYQTTHGFRCYPALTDVPFAPDLALIALPAQDVLATLRSCFERGIRAAVVFAAGFADVGTDAGHALQAQLQAFAAESGMAVAGPNTFGFVNFIDGCYASFNLLYLEAPQPVQDAGIALLSQGGGPCSITYDGGRKRGVRFSYAIASGNEACVHLEDYLEFLADDQATSAVIAYMEGINDGPRFFEVANRLREAGKPLVIYKVGDTEAGAKAAVSHTARMTGSQQLFHAAFRQLNVVIAEDVDMMPELAYLFQFKQRKAGLRAGIVTASGALNAIYTDCYVSRGLTVEPFSDELKTRISDHLPKWGHAAHPVDLSPSIDPDDIGRIMEIMLASSEVDFVTFFSTGPLIDRWVKPIIRAALSTDKLLAVMFAGECRSVPELEEGGICVFRETMKGARALAAFAHWHAGMSGPTWQPPRRSFSAGNGAITPLLADAVAQGRHFLDEFEGKQLLSGYGIPVAAEKVATDRFEAADTAESLGYPVAMKVLSAEILHKSDIGGVRLGIESRSAAEAIFDELAEIQRSATGSGDPKILLQKQVSPGVELLVSVTAHPLLGHYVSIASGGVTAELIKDVVHRMLPVTEEEVLAALRELALFPLLEGYRRSGPRDIGAVTTLVSNLSRLVVENATLIRQVEINPVIVGGLGQGASVVDCVVELMPTARTASSG